MAKVLLVLLGSWLLLGCGETALSDDPSDELVSSGDQPAATIVDNSSAAAADVATDQSMEGLENFIDMNAHDVSENSIVTYLVNAGDSDSDAIQIALANFQPETDGNILGMLILSGCHSLDGELRPSIDGPVEFDWLRDLPAETNFAKTLEDCGELELPPQFQDFSQASTSVQIRITGDSTLTMSTASGATDWLVQR